MEFALPALIGISIAAMFFGYFFGLFEGRGQGYKKRQKEEALDRQVGPVSPAEKPPAARSRNLLEVNLDDAGHPCLHIDGRQVDALKVAPDQRRRLIELMVMLRPWVDPAAAQSASGLGAQIPGSSPAPVPHAAGEQAAREAREPAVARSARAASPARRVAVPASLSIVAQIDLILQARLAGTPLAGRGIRVAEALHGGAIVFIGTEQYDGVDKVPDAEVQAAIRAATAEWENRYTPS
jgi:hypothetical protein